MAQAGLHAAIGYSLKFAIPKKKGVLPAIIFGAILPDLDILLVVIASIFISIEDAQHLYHRSFSHSFFTIFLFYLIFALISEWKKEPLYKSIGKGLILGILSHIIIDTFFWFSGIQFLWPLPFKPFNFWSFWQAPNIIHNTMLTLEFFCFYWYAWFLVSKHLDMPNKESWIIKYLQYWKSIEKLLFFSFIILSYLQPKGFLVLFGLAYIPSIIMALWATYKSRHAIDII